MKGIDEPMLPYYPYPYLDNIKKVNAYITLLIYENGELTSVQSQNRTFSEEYHSITFNPHGKRAANETYEFIVNYVEEVND